MLMTPSPAGWDEGGGVFVEVKLNCYTLPRTAVKRGGGQGEDCGGGDGNGSIFGDRLGVCRGLCLRVRVSR